MIRIQGIDENAWICPDCKNRVLITEEPRRACERARLTGTEQGACIIRGYETCIGEDECDD